MAAVQQSNKEGGMGIVIKGSDWKWGTHDNEGPDDIELIPPEQKQLSLNTREWVLVKVSMTYALTEGLEVVAILKEETPQDKSVKLPEKINKPVSCLEDTVNGILEYLKSKESK